MKIKTKVTSGLSLDCRTLISFNKDEVLEVGDKGLSEDNLKHLVEIDFAELVLDETAVIEPVVVVEEEKQEVVKKKSKKKAKIEDEQGGNE